MPKRKDPKLVKTEILQVRMPKDLRDRVFYAATSEALDMSAFARMLIKQGMDRYEKKRKRGKS